MMDHTSANIFQTLSHNKKYIMGQFNISQNIKSNFINKARAKQCINLQNACNIIDHNIQLFNKLIRDYNQFEEQCVRYFQHNTVSEDDVDTINANIEQFNERYNIIKEAILVQTKLLG